IDSLSSRLTFDSSTQIRYQINNDNDSGTWSVRVNNPGGASSGWAIFTVEEQGLSPEIYIEPALISFPCDGTHASNSTVDLVGSPNMRAASATDIREISKNEDTSPQDPLIVNPDALDSDQDLIWIAVKFDERTRVRLVKG